MMEQRLRRTWPVGKRCLFCMYWMDRSLSHGDCRRFPAKVVTEHTDFCGEFVKHREQPEPGMLTRKGRAEPKSKSEKLT